MSKPHIEPLESAMAPFHVLQGRVAMLETRVRCLEDSVRNLAVLCRQLNEREEALGHQMQEVTYDQDLLRGRVLHS